VATGSNGTVVFPFTSSNTTSTPFGTPSTIKLYGGGAAISVAIDPQNRLLYIGETDDFSSSTTNSGGLRVFTIASSGPTELTSTPYAPLGTGPHAILPDKTGDYVYVASWQTGTTGVITGYSVTTSALTALTTTVSTGTEPKGLAEDNTKSFVLAVSYSGGPYFDAYTLTAGQPSSPATGSTVTDPIAIVAAP
jgi:6-phosphogluconolactonase (cycloisomerase 2 family)